MHNGGTAVPKVLPLSHPAPKQHFSEKLCQMKYKNECLLFLAASVVKLNPKHTAVIIIRLYPYLIAMDIADAACFSFAVFMILLHVSPADVAMYCHCAVFVRAAVILCTRGTIGELCLKRVLLLLGRYKVAVCKMFSERDGESSQLASGEPFCSRSCHLDPIHQTCHAKLVS